MSDVGQAIGTVVGGVIGFFVGGPAGAAKGAALGYSLTASRQKAESPTYSFGDKYNTASQTIPVPVVYGKNLVAGNTLYKKVSGTNNENMAIQIAVSEGPIQSITAIKANEVDITSKCRIKLGNRVQTADVINEYGQTFPYTAYISTELTADENLSGNPTITSIVEGRKVEVWNGSSWVIEYSQNPAYVILDFLKNPIYGLGWSDEDIDLQSFIDAAAYCDEIVDGEPRFQLDYIIDYQQASPDHIEEMLITFRGFLTYNQGVVGLRIDGPGEIPVQDFDMKNIVEESLVYRQAKKDERLNKAIVNFTDANDNFEVQGIYASLDGDIKRRGLVDDTFSLYGVNRRSQAGRMAHYFQRKSFFTPTTVEYRAGIDSINCEAGDVVRITHDVPGWVQKKFRVLQIKEFQNDEMVLYAQEYNEAVYDDTGVVQQVKRDTSLPNPFEPPTSVTGLSLVEQNEVLGDGTWVPQVKVSYTRPDSIYWRAGNIYLSYDDGATWDFKGRVEGERHVIPNVAPGTYKIRVVSENNRGIKEDFSLAMTGTITIVGKDAPPSDVSFDAGCVFESTVNASWQAIPDVDIEYYELRADTNFGADDAGLLYRGTDLQKEFVPKQRSYNLYIKAKDHSGNYSTNAGHILLENAVPPAPPVPSITAFFSGFWIEIMPVPGANDIGAYYLYMTPSDGAGSPLDGAVAQKKRVNPGKVDITASTGSSFIFEVSAVDALGEGPKSTPVEATTSDIPADVIGDTQIKDAAITAQKLADAAVEGRSIVDGAVSELKLANLAVTAQKLADGAINSDKIQDGSVLTGKLKDAAVTAQKLAEGAVEDRHINAVSGTKIVGGTIEENKMKWEQHLIF